MLEQAASTISAAPVRARSGPAWCRSGARGSWSSTAGPATARRGLCSRTSSAAAPPTRSVAEDRVLADACAGSTIAVLCAADLDLAAVGVRVGRGKASPATAVGAAPERSRTMDWKREGKWLAGIVGAFFAALLPAGGHDALRRGPARGVPPRQVVRPRARAALPGAGLLHRRGDRRLRQPGGGDEVPRRRRLAPDGLRRRLDLGHRARRLLVHRAAALRRHLQARRGPRPGLGLPLLRPGDQRAGDHPDRPRARLRARRRPRRRRGRLQRARRPRDGLDLPP